jgi:hypothetical protein
MSVLREAGGILAIRCLHCRHEVRLSRQTLARVGLKPDAPISTFVKRLRCSECGSGSVMAKRIAAPLAARSRQKRRA